MPYTQFTQTQLIAQISLLLQDTGNLYWKSDEIARAINEALYYWGALTSYWRDRGTFSTAPATHFYDLGTQLPLLRARTFTVDAICREVEYALFELSAGVTGTGLTAQFSINQITSAVIAAADQFTIDATQPLKFTTVAVAAPPADGRVTLPQTVVAVSRVAWKSTSTGIWTVLRREDEYSAQAFNPTWTTPGQPLAYAMADAPPLTIQLIPPPVAAGTIHLLYNDAPALTTTGPTAALGIPDELALAVKWYALYLLLDSYNEGFDAYRAKYAYERYQQCVATAELMRSVNRIQIASSLIPLDTLWNLDAAIPQWMNQKGLPAYSATSWDLLSLAPLANATTRTVTCDVVRSAPVPVTGTDFIQVGREELSYITDYVRHILSFKLGGTEFGATFPLYDNFIAGAKQRNTLLSTRVRYLTALFEQAKSNENLMPTA